MSPRISALYGTLADAYQAVADAHQALADDERLPGVEQREHRDLAYAARDQYRRAAGAYMLAKTQEFAR